MNEDVQRLNFGEHWTKETVLAFPVAILVVLAALFLLFCPRKYAAWPFIIVGCFVAPPERIVLASLTFSMLRLLTIIGLMRVIMRNEIQISWKPLDTCMTVFVIARVLFALFYTSSEFVTRLGASIDTLGAYILFRLLIRSWDDVFFAVRGFVWCAVPVAAVFAYEHFAQANPFRFEAPDYFSKNGVMVGERYRAQGAFSHPILAGCFWATMMPLMAVMWWRGPKERIEACIGIFCALIIVVAAASSTPVAAVMFAVIGGAMFFMRRLLAWVRWGVVAALCLVQLLWDKPVWRLLAKADILSGSTGYQRYALIDGAFKNLSDWIFVGGEEGITKYWGPNLKDVTNNYLLVGLNGGILLLLLFLTMLFFAFYTVGKMLRRAEREHRTVTLYAAWALGVALFCHCMVFLTVSYFGQIVMAWTLLLAIIGSMTPSRARRKVRYRVAQAQQTTSEPAISHAQGFHGSAQ